MRRTSLMIVIMVLIGCENANGGGNSTTPSNITNRVITPKDKMPTNTAGAFENYKPVRTEPVEINLDDLPFSEAFRIEHHAKGQGDTFWWRSEEYTTNLYQEYGEVTNIHSVGYTTWVRNSDDIDDHCRINEFDECGTCNGTGAIIWYLDRDEDGLGDSKTWTKSCEYPSVDEE